MRGKHCTFKLKYILPPYTADNIEKQYKELAKILHPDKGGDKESFQELTREKTVALELAKYYKMQGPQTRQRVKMKARKKNPVHQTNITFVIDPDKIADVIQLLKNFI